MNFTLVWTSTYVALAKRECLLGTSTLETPYWGQFTKLSGQNRILM